MVDLHAKPSRRPVSAAVILRRRFVLVSMGLGMISPSCSTTYQEEIAPVQQAFYAGDLERARAEVEDMIEEAGPAGADTPALYLERAVIDLASGNAEKAEETLRAVRDLFDELEAQELAAFTGELTTYFTDDRFRAYSGEDYEKIMIRVFLAFANMLRGGGDVVAYANQVLEKQREILDQIPPDRREHSYKENYKKIGIGAYLYGLVTEERDPTAGGEVRVSYQKVESWEPQFTSIREDIERATEGVHSPPGHGVVYVFAFVGKGPVKYEYEEHDLAAISEISLQMTRFFPIIRENFGATLDLSPIRIPVVRPRGDNPIEACRVTVDGQVGGETETLTDVTRTAVQQFNQVRDWVLAKAVIRRMIKKAITTAAKGAAKMAVRGDDDRRRRSTERDMALVAIELGGIFVNTLWSALERADTRFWSLLPDRIQVLRLELPAGEHRVSVTPRFAGTLEGTSRSVAVSVLSSENTYVFAFVPTPGAGPPLLTSRPAREDLATPVGR